MDFVINDLLAVEVKVKNNISARELKGLKALKEEQKIKYYIVASLEKSPGIVDGIHILPWNIFLDRLWAGKYI